MFKYQLNWDSDTIKGLFCCTKKYFKRESKIFKCDYITGYSIKTSWNNQILAPGLQYYLKLKYLKRKVSNWKLK